MHRLESRRTGALNQRAMLVALLGVLAFMFLWSINLAFGAGEGPFDVQISVNVAGDTSTTALDAFEFSAANGDDEEETILPSASGNPFHYTLAGGTQIAFNFHPKPGYKIMSVVIDDDPSEVAVMNQKHFFTGDSDHTMSIFAVPYNTLSFDCNFPADAVDTRCFGEMKTIVNPAASLTLPKNEFYIPGYVFDGWATSPAGALDSY